MLLDANCDPLADGSIIQIIGDGGEGAANGFAMNPLGLDPTSVQGDDIFIGQFPLNGTPDGSTSNAGTFYNFDFTFDDTVVDSLYIRVFDTNMFPAGTFTVDYAISDLAGYTSFFGIASVGFRRRL